MIAYVRGRLRDRPVGSVVEVTTDDGSLTATLADDGARLEASEPVIVARTEVEVGVSRRPLAVLLGSWSKEAADPAGPLGLASTPIVVLAGPTLGDLATAGARRAGHAPSIAMVGGRATSLGLVLLDAVQGGADVVLIEHGGGEALRLIRALGGRALAALPLEEPAAVARLFDGLDLDVHVPVPSCEDPLCDRIRAVLAPLGLEALHHLVEVDPAPAFEELRLDVADADLDQLGAAAAGVLAGRLAATNRRWRRELEA